MKLMKMMEGMLLELYIVITNISNNSKTMSEEEELSCSVFGGSQIGFYRLHTSFQKFRLGNDLCVF